MDPEIEVGSIVRVLATERLRGKKGTVVQVELYTNYPDIPDRYLVETSDQERTWLTGDQLELLQ